MPGYLEHFSWLCEDILRAKGYRPPYPMEWVESIWNKMCASVSDGRTVVVLAFVGKGLFGLLEFFVEQPLTMLSGVVIERLILEPRFNREKIARVLMESASQHARTIGGRLEALARNPHRRLELNWRDLRFSVSRESAVVPPRIWYPVEKPTSQIEDAIIKVPCYDLPLSMDFYCNKIGLSFMAFRYLGVFVNAGAAILLLDQVEEFLRDPDPLLECRVLDIFTELERLKQRNVYVIPQGRTYMERRGIITHEDGAKGAAIRDPDGNLLALRQETRESRKNYEPPIPLSTLTPPGK